ncbi:XRE family transcriptional regulator [Streptococcus ratti]|uniref:HTH cro/C1-type domain-containing protein n=1 Tax=Streptococcus ratti FA-1 = DSM 20564 TaxID=699248 RepID=A0ABN0GV88_STRRT|nr:helix-turn-helix transcriptional regulator [Streptococcus ratti]EJN94420.1 hypothetical protein SRA_07781 [Streptococcus ratti FA-1 = DSM 20564]EMP70054.1 hypothetical protein D822_05661 [Streptococcus ratti FA-1 = DSM 20564]QEY06361.1 helix-turn-helix transcriptional regulator [Streptococcus ratti]VEI60704.1 Uncharacterised protein [Streptococcus mutans]
MLNSKIKTIYCELLGESLKQKLQKLEIPQNSVSYYFADEIKLIPATTISQILKGKRNITLDTVEALQDTLELPNMKSVFFPNINFCESLIHKLIQFILTDEHFNGENTKKLFQIKEKQIQKNIFHLAISLYEYFPDFPYEETSYRIADSLTEWFIEFVALVAQL